VDQQQKKKDKDNKKRAKNLENRSLRLRDGEILDAKAKTNIWFWAK
jgi:hypothetical protein